MDVTFQIDDSVFQNAKNRAEGQGTTVEELVREFLKDFAGNNHLDALAEEFMRLSPQGNSNGWKFNRKEIHDREAARKDFESRSRGGV